LLLHIIASFRHPGLDPGSMNTNACDHESASVFMDADFRQHDDFLGA